MCIQNANYLRNAIRTYIVWWIRCQPLYKYQYCWAARAPPLKLLNQEFSLVHLNSVRHEARLDNDLFGTNFWSLKIIECDQNSNPFYMIFGCYSFNRTFGLCMLKYIYRDNMNLTYFYILLHAESWTQQKCEKSKINCDILTTTLYVIASKFVEKYTFFQQCLLYFPHRIITCTCNIRIQTAYFFVDSIEWLYTSTHISPCLYTRAHEVNWRWMARVECFKWNEREKKRARECQK